MWNGTADGQEDGFVDVSNGNTNALPPKIINVTVQDIRNQEPQPSVNTDGYELLRRPTSIPAEVFENPLTEENKEILVTAYFEECRRLVQEITGAAETFTFIHRIRSQNTDFNNALDFKQDAFKGTVPLAHVDRDPVTAPERLRSSMGEERAEALMKKYKRWAIVNVWRPIGPAVQKWPLGFVNHHAIPDWHYNTHMGHLHTINNPAADERGAKTYENILKHDPRYKYHYASNMTSDEVLLFSAFHSDPRLGIPHGAFWDDNTAKDAPGRASIEVRTWAFFD